MADPVLHSLPQLQKTSAFAEDLSVGARASKFAFRRGVSALGHFGGVLLGVSTAATAAISQWDHHVEKKRITEEYEQEIAAGLGKPPHKITMGDMEKAAKGNPAMGEALKRSTTRRNLSIGVTVAAAVIALVVLAPVAHAAVALAIPALAAHAVIHSLVVGSVAGLGFLGVEKGLEKIGEKKFGLEEPSIKKVLQHPGKQHELSLSSQITLLAHKQAHGEAVSQEQVMTVFTSANSVLDKQVEANFGKRFGKLNDADKRKAIERFGDQYDIKGLTADVNGHEIRAQELAFAAYGQASGVAPTGVSRIREMEHQAATLNAQIATQAPEMDSDVAARPKLAFAKAQVSITAPKQQQVEETAWRRRIEAQRREQQAAVGVA